MKKNRTTTDPFVQQFFARIPPKTATTFTEAQLDTLKQVYGMRISKGHAIDIRLSIPFPKQGFYFVFLSGQERRSKQRLAQERQQHPIFTVANSLVLAAIVLFLLTSSFGTIYVLKMKLIPSDMMSGKSPIK